VNLRVTLIGKPGCHLCDVARSVVELVCAEEDQDFAELDVTTDPFLASEYADAVPVVLVDDAEVGRYRVSPATIRAALRNGPRR
jgi:hypothetical protein